VKKQTIKLARCIHTGALTGWRTKTGDPALSEAGLRVALAHDPKALEAALKHPGVKLETLG